MDYSVAIDATKVRMAADAVALHPDAVRSRCDKSRDDRVSGVRTEHQLTQPVFDMVGIIRGVLDVKAISRPALVFVVLNLHHHISHC